MAEDLHQAGYDLLDPVGASAEMPSSAAGEGVHLLPPALPFRPGSPDQPLFLQPVQDRVQRPVSEAKETIAVGLHVQCDLVPVLRFFPKRNLSQSRVQNLGQL